MDTNGWGITWRNRTGNAHFPFTVSLLSSAQSLQVLIWPRGDNHRGRTAPASIVLFPSFWPGSQKKLFWSQQDQEKGGSWDTQCLRSRQREMVTDVPLPTAVRNLRPLSCVFRCLPHNSDTFGGGFRDISLESCLSCWKAKVVCMPVFLEGDFSLWSSVFLCAKLQFL